MHYQIVMNRHDLEAAFNSYDALYALVASVNNLDAKNRSKFGQLDMELLKEAYLKDKTLDHICVASDDLCAIIGICHWLIKSVAEKYCRKEDYINLWNALDVLNSTYLGGAALDDNKNYQPMENHTDTVSVAINDLIWLFNFAARCNDIESNAVLDEDYDDNVDLRESYTIRKDAKKLRQLVVQYNCAGWTDPHSVLEL